MVMGWAWFLIVASGYSHRLSGGGPGREGGILGIDDQRMTAEKLERWS